MTERQWLICVDPRKMLTFLRDKANDRKSRLFAVACCRQVWKWLTDKRTRAAVQVAEQFADKKATKKQLTQARKEVRQAVFDQIETYWRQRAFHAALNSVETDFDSIAFACENVSGAIISHPRMKVEEYKSAMDYQSSLLRCIFGNPFLPVTFKSSWNSSTVKDLAESIYTDVAFDRMPILADALEDAGCTNSAILEHCRGPGPHGRGCWALDLILSKDR